MAQATLTKDGSNRTTGKSNRRKMVRKQVYLQPQQEMKLKELAERQHTTEAEIIRDAIDALLATPTMPNGTTLPRSEAAWLEMLAYVDKLENEGVPGEPYKWNRADAYDEDHPRGWNVPD